ncbi:MAG TPA: DMT family transporter, partial [Paracoccaceae bacterium]|nr:DMT family transporter [Paracoccaceae bacterium]
VLVMFLFTCMDACAKYLLERNNTVMVVWARFASQTALVLAISAPQLGTLARARRPGLQLVRSALHSFSTGLFFLSLNFMQLAEAAAVFEVAPLLITVLAAWILAEKVGPRRWAGVAIGLGGALIIIRPGLDVFQPAALLPLGAALTMAGFQITTRMIGTADRMGTTMLYSALVGLIGASAVLPWFWETPSMADALLMATFGWLGYLGHLVLVYALAQAPASTLAPYNYADFLWALLIGFLVFSELPDAPTLIGAGVILGSGIYVWHRERVHARLSSRGLLARAPRQRRGAP